MLRRGAASRLWRHLQAAAPLGEAGACAQAQPAAAAATASRHSASAAAVSNTTAVADGGAPCDTGRAQHSGWQLAFAALLGLTGAASSSRAEAEKAPPPEEGTSGSGFLSLDHRRRTFFKYEKRIREMSPPQKVFEYFASQTADGKVFSMTASDMMRSVVPVFPPEGSDTIRAGSLPGEPSPRVHDTEVSRFIQKFDINGDNAIGFDEFLLFQALLSIPLEDLEVAFRLMDKDGSGKVDRREFCQLLDALELRALKPSSTMRKSAVAYDSDQALHGLMTTFFGEDGRGLLSLDAFRSFVCDLRDELLRLEFEHYDWRHGGYISGRDFAHSVIGSARLKHVDQYLDRCQSLPAELAHTQVSFADFKQFRDVWRQLRLLSVALEFLNNTNGRVGRTDFAWTVEHVLGVKLRPQLVDILFHLFSDVGQDLNINHMYQVLNRHYATGLSISYHFDKPREAKSYMACMRECMAG